MPVDRACPPLPNAPTRPAHGPWLWDVFCRVIDNHGDLGVCWRLSAQLAALGHRVRLWVDDASALSWMAPTGARGVTVRSWDELTAPPASRHHPPADVWVEAFGCEIPPEFIAACAYPSSEKCQKHINFPVWVNLEYLSAEPYVRRCHGLPSPVMTGAARGETKHFFYPGFTPGTGGLLREPDLLQRQARFDRQAWLAEQGIAWHGERLISLFCYEPPALAGWLQTIAQGPEPTQLLVASGRPAQALALALQSLGWHEHAPQGTLQWHLLSALPQPTFDELLWACDVNFVRGEDSLVRALWAGQPFIWHIYPQDDGAHTGKLNAFLDWLQAPDDVRHAHHRWNQPPHPNPAPFSLPERATHHNCVRQARSTLLAQPDLVTQLVWHVQQVLARQHSPR